MTSSDLGEFLLIKLPVILAVAIVCAWVLMLLIGAAHAELGLDETWSYGQAFIAWVLLRIAVAVLFR